MASRRRLSLREQLVGMGLTLPYVVAVVWLLGDKTAMAWKPLLAPPGVLPFVGWYLWRTRRPPQLNPLPAVVEAGLDAHDCGPAKS